MANLIYITLGYIIKLSFDTIARSDFQNGKANWFRISKDASKYLEAFLDYSRGKPHCFNYSVLCFPDLEVGYSFQ